MKRPPRRSAGFTLVELMVSMTIVGFILIGVLPFFLSNSKLLFIAGQKLLINADVRNFTNNMIQDAQSASTFVLYQSFYGRTSATGASISRDYNGDGVINTADRMQSGQSGDFLVLVYYQDPFYNSSFYSGTPPASLPTTATVTRMVGYWLAPNVNYSGQVALYRFDTDQFKGSGATWTTPWGATFPAQLSSSVTFESLLPAATSTAASASTYASIVLNNLQGLSSGLNFVNYAGRAVLVRSRILHGNLAQEVTNTYNFTVYPRG